ncbi:epigen isoform X1 [Sigmodon hispidus]
MKYKWKKDSESAIKPSALQSRRTRERRTAQRLQDMALRIPMAVCLLFKAMTAALTEEAEVHMMPSSTVQQSNWLVNDTEGETSANYTEGPAAFRFSHPCLEDHNSYCINGVCAFHRELKKAICRCFTGYTGERCEHLTLTSYAVDSYEKYVAIGIGVGLLISAFLAVLYCYIRKREMKSNNEKEEKESKEEKEEDEEEEEEKRGRM